MEVIVTVVRVGDRHGWFSIVNGVGRRAIEGYDKVVFERKADPTESVSPEELLKKTLSEVKAEAEGRGITDISW